MQTPEEEARLETQINANLTQMVADRVDADKKGKRLIWQEN